MKKLIKLLEVEKGAVELKKGTSDSEIKKYTDKGIDVQLVDPRTETLEEEAKKYTSEESAAVGKEVARSLVKVLRAQGDELKNIKLTGIGANKFNIHVEYGQEKGQDTFKFTLNPELKSIALATAQGPVELCDFIITQGNEVSLPTPELEDQLSDAMVKYHSEPSDEEYDEMAAMQTPTDPSQLNKNIAEEFTPNVAAGSTYAVQVELRGNKLRLSQDNGQEVVVHMEDVDDLIKQINRLRGGLTEKLTPKSKPETYNKIHRVPVETVFGKNASIKPSMKEDLDIGHQDDEPAMLKSDVYRIAKMAAMLYKELDKYGRAQEVDFPHWWQAKIIKAYDYLQGAYGYLDGQNKVAQLDTTGVLALNEKQLQIQRLVKKSDFKNLIVEAYVEVLREEEAPALKTSTQEILGKFPTVKKTLVSLFTNEYDEFIEDVKWTVPKPSTFMIALKNGQSFDLKWTGKGFEANVEGKRYFLNNVAEYQQALDSLNRILKDGPISQGEEPGGEDFAAEPPAGGTGGEFPGAEAGAEETPAETGAEEFAAAEETPEAL